MGDPDPGVHKPPLWSLAVADGRHIVADADLVLVAIVARLTRPWDKVANLRPALWPQPTRQPRVAQPKMPSFQSR